VVFSVSADPLSPERGSYGFAQNMLRQVAYDTLSRRDRKARHLKVAEHLRAAFPGDGEEVTDVIARHYLDALDAVPEDPDAAVIRQRAAAALIRAAERAERTGAPALAATNYAIAAELSTLGAVTGEPREGRPSAGALWERAAEAATTSGDWAAAVGYAERAHDHYRERGQARAGARAQAVAGHALRAWGHHAEAREQLTAALEVLRADPDADTVRALAHLAELETFAGSPDADTLTTEALTLGQALGSGPAQLADLFTVRGIHLGMTGRRPQASAYFREAARLAEPAGDTFRLGRALVNLSDILSITEPEAAAEAARAAAEHLRRAGRRDHLAVAITNRSQALITIGDWDAANGELTRAVEADGLADIEFVPCQQAWLAAMRGDEVTAASILAALPNIRASEDPQDQGRISLVEAFAAGHDRAAALRHARATLAHAGTLGLSGDDQRWAWALAVRAAHDLGDTGAVRELLAMLGSYPVGQLAPMLLAERDLARARLASAEEDRDAGASFAAAISGLREMSTPYHLAHGLLDYAEHLTSLGDTEAAAAAIGEAREIAGRLRCQPLLDRAAALTPAGSRVRA
jgi:tetratricopeptide (TPR) repeat protein